ncbi:MAG: caspase family protein [Chitinophagaceae bacterium]
MINYALVIGIDDYQHKDLGKLKGAKGDAIDIKNWLLESGHVEEENCYYVIADNDMGTFRDEIEDEIKKLICQAKKTISNNNRLYFYFAGHGLGVRIDSTNNALCLTNWSREANRAALSSKEYFDIFIRFSLFRQVFFLADCCRNTRYNANPLPPDLNPDAPVGPYKTQSFLAYATQYRALTLEVMDQQNLIRGIFTRIFLKGVRGGAVNSEGIITTDSLKKYMKVHVPAEAAKFGFDQDPDMPSNLNDHDPLFPPIAGPPPVCTVLLTLKPHRQGKISLLDEHTNLVKVFYTGDHTQYEFRLSQGTYLLIDAERKESTFLDVKQLGHGKPLEFEF